MSNVLNWKKADCEVFFNENLAYTEISKTKEGREYIKFNFLLKNLILDEELSLTLYFNNKDIEFENIVNRIKLKEIDKNLKLIIGDILVDKYFSKDKIKLIQKEYQGNIYYNVSLKEPLKINFK